MLVHALVVLICTPVSDTLGLLVSIGTPVSDTLCTGVNCETGKYMLVHALVVLIRTPVSDTLGLLESIVRQVNICWYILICYALLVVHSRFCNHFEE